MKKLPIVAIVGRANVGKSSIFNSLLSRREAIVAREEGTTRDSIMAKVEFQGHDFWIVDTAGMKDPNDNFEATIQEQIAQAVDSADIIWVVVEADTIITKEDRDVATLALKSRKPVFLIVNKIDKAKSGAIDNYQKLGIKPIFETSATQNRGFSDLLQNLVKVIPKKQERQDDNTVKVALIGRPNVGKSQLFNTMLKKQEAIVSDRAGTTRDVNKKSVRFENQTIEFMDTAGIRRSGKIGTGIEHFSVIRTLSAIEQADVTLLLMDVNELNVQLDQKIAGMAKESNKGLILVVSKWDSLEEKDHAYQEILAKLKYNYQFVPWASVIATSSETGQNVTNLFNMILEIAKERKKKVKTTELNRWLKKVTNAHPPAGLRSFTPKLNYMLQEADNDSPNFKIYGSHTKYLHWSYKRYMEKELRESFGFEGTALKLWFFEKHVDRKKEMASPRERKR